MGKRLYAIIGNPVLHSRSPLIFNYWFQKRDLPAIYSRVLATDLDSALNLCQKLNIQGCNVTAPFKAQILDKIADLSPEVRVIGAANTVIRRDGYLSGFNTDVNGILGAMLWGAQQMNKVPALVIGAGGAACAAIYALKKLSARISVVNRTDAKARQLAERFGINFWQFADIKHAVCQSKLIIVAISENTDLLKPEWFNREQILIDANYIHTTLPAIAAATGAHYIPGTVWLEQQARQSFKIFTDEEAPALPDNFAYQNPYSGRLRNLALIGFMGAGKTALGQSLAQRLRWRFIDLDSVIVHNGGKSISTIFQKYGESEFRRLETAALQQVLRSKNQVIACGGGIVISQHNRQLLQSKTTVIYLHANPQNIWQRIDKTDRPLLHGIHPLNDAVRLYNERQDFYLSIADAILDTEQMSITQATELLHAEINNLL